MTEAEIKYLPKPAKIAATQAFTDLGFSIRQIAKFMNLDVNTVMRYQDKELDDQFRLFSDNIKKVYLEQDFELAQLAVSHIKQKIDKARFFELVGLLKTVRELQRPQQVVNQQVVNQNTVVANIPDALSKKYDAS